MNRSKRILIAASLLGAMLAPAAMAAEQQDVRAIVEANFKAADADGDGSLNAAEFPSLINANADSEIGRAAMIRRFGAYDRAFSTADQDGDGAVTWSELVANRPGGGH